MLPVDKIIVDEAGQNKASQTFTAQWYQHVTAYVKQTGTGLSLSVKLQGSINNVDWVDIGTPITANGILTNFDGTKLVYYLYYRVWITTNSGTNNLLNAWMGAGGA
jgi:hypothetical protein